MTKAPVCGVSIEETRAAAKMTHHGKTYYFCSPRCHQAFQKNPQVYLKAPGPPK